MDSVTLTACTRAATKALQRWLPHGMARHVAGQALTCWACDESISLAPQVEESLRHLRGAGFREAVPELSDEQIERAARRVVVVVEHVLSTVGPVPVAGELDEAVGSQVHGDHQVERVGVVEGHGPHGGQPRG